MLLKFLNDNTLKNVSRLLGPLEILTTQKVFHCVNVYLKDYDKYDWFLITNRSAAPTIKEDAFILMFLRSFCDGILNSVFLIIYFFDKNINEGEKFESRNSRIP